MLGKLLKYELKAMGRIILPLYLVLVLASGLLAVNIKLNDNSVVLSGFMNLISIILTLLFAACILVVIIAMVLLIVQRFRRNLLGTEGYLMFTLPATTLDHILSKLLSSLIWIVTGIAAGCCAGFLMVVVISDLGTFQEFVSSVIKDLESFLGRAQIRQQMSLLVILLVLAIMKAITQIYAAIAVGHQFQNHRGILSFAAYIIFSVIEMLIGLLPFMENLGQPGGFLYSDRYGSLPVSMGLSIIGILIYGAITWFLLDRHLNLE